MFHFPTFPPHALCVQARVTPHDWCGVPPFGHPRINARLAAPRGLSQPPTSFIGSWCPGIHRVPLTTWPHNHNTPHPHRRHAAHHHPPLPGSTIGVPPATARRGAPTQSKMLASTVQFSTTNRPPPGPAPAEPHPGRHPHTADAPDRWAVRGPGRPRHETTTPAPARTGDGPAPSGPNSVPTPGRPHPPRSPPASAGRTSSG
jgi:hypothetical protein